MYMYRVKEKGDERRPNLNREDDDHQRKAGNKPDHESKGGEYHDKKDRLGKQKKAELLPYLKPENKPKGKDDRGKQGAAHGNRGKGSK